MAYSVTVKQVAHEYNLKLLNEDECINISERLIEHPEVNRPALQLAGFFDYFDPRRLQILGNMEHSYLKKLTDEKREEIFETLFAYPLPCVVLCRNLEPFPNMLELATKNEIPVFNFEGTTTEFMGEIIRWLNVKLAPRTNIHGVLVDIYGEGVLITGESGIGKSESALELIKRGHRLVADDNVDVKKVSTQTLVGSSPEVLRHMIELRGIGIIDVRQMFGVQAVKATQAVDLVIKLENWDDKKEYDRLGLNENYMEILGNRVICHCIPVRSGRNLAIICESAAINHRQKKMGYNAAKVLTDRVMASNAISFDEAKE
ncbi:HPr kinase/phosphorylase [Clostridia bacterium]|nr:HPr kinase/phosphorylase [Clostridia bacterium]